LDIGAITTTGASIIYYEVASLISLIVRWFVLKHLRSLSIPSEEDRISFISSSVHFLGTLGIFVNNPHFCFISHDLNITLTSILSVTT